MERFLILDDDDVFRRRLARAFEERGFQVFQADSLNAAREIIQEVSPDYAVVDLCLVEESGLKFVSELQAKTPRTRALVLTGFGSIVTAVEAMQLGAVNYISKPADADTILAALTGSEQKIEISADIPELKTVEWEHIQRVLHRCGGNISKTSKLLGVHRRSLQRKLARMPNRSS